MASCLEENGQYEEAIRLLEIALRERSIDWTTRGETEQHEGANAATLENFQLLKSLGYLYWLTKQDDSGVLVFEKLEQLTKENLPKNHNMTIGATANLAANYISSGKLEAGIEKFESISEQAKSSKRLFWIRASLRKAYLDAGLVGKLRKTIEEDIEAAKIVFANDPDGLWQEFQHCGNQLFEAECYRDAELIYRELIELSGDGWRHYGAKASTGFALARQAELLIKQMPENEDDLASEDRTDVRRLLIEAGSLLSDGYAGLKKQADDIPPKTLVILNQNSIKGLVLWAELSGNVVDREKWKLEMKKVTEQSEL